MLSTVLLYLAVANFYPAFTNSDIVQSNKTSDDYVPCEKGWYYFRDNCYRGEGGKEKALIWSSALARCREYGGDLLSIHSQEEQDFIIAFLILEHKSLFWTGLNDHGKESVYTWSDGSVVNYTNWPSSDPRRHRDEEDCVYMYLKPLGTWNDMNCDYASNYICKMKPNPRKRSPNLKYCSPEEGGGLKFKTSCYHLVTESQAWSNAEIYCKSNYNGHLLSIRQTLKDLFLEYALPDIKTETWIGIKIQEHLQYQKWTSGWYVTNAILNSGEHFKDGNCIARKNRKEWIMIPCSTELPFICEVSKETFPVLKSPPIGSYCPKEMDDWQDFGGDYCYFIQTNTKVNFSEARSHCEGRGGDLVSIHSQEETDILHPFIKNTAGSIYIGLVRGEGSNDNLFEWIDGSVVDYKNWDAKEPNKKEEKCVEAMTLTMKWKDTLCSKEVSGYICSAKKIVPSSEVLPVTGKSSRHVSLKTLTGVSLCIQLALILLSLEI